MRFEERRTLIVLIIAGVVGAILFMPAVYFFGLWLAPPRPVPAASHVPRLFGDALWARADGGRATELTPLNPINFVQHRVCRAMAARVDDLKLRGERRAECMKQLPAVQAADYLSGVHMRDEQVDERSFRMAIGHFATAAWLTRSWTRAELLDTLSERGAYGFGWRGADRAARNYFNRSLGDLTLSQAALLAAFIGDRDVDPWCDPNAARDLRQRLLERMLDNQAIDEAAFRSANEGGLGLGDPPPQHRPCGA